MRRSKSTNEVGFVNWLPSPPKHSNIDCTIPPPPGGTFTPWASALLTCDCVRASLGEIHVWISGDGAKRKKKRRLPGIYIWEFPRFGPRWRLWAGKSAEAFLFSQNRDLKFAAMLIPNLFSGQFSAILLFLPFTGSF